MQWKKATGMNIGERLFLGRWDVGGCYYDSSRNKNDVAKYAATCSLPGIKSLLGHYESKLEAKNVLEKAVGHWLKGAESHKGG